MTNRHTPPGFTSIAKLLVTNPLGPHHCVRCFGSVQTSNTSSRGALRIRVATISRSPTSVAGMLPSFILLLLLLKFLEVFVQAVETLVPEPAVMLHPLGHALERLPAQPARPPLRLPPALDQPGPLQHLQML